MKKILWACILTYATSFADIHPALKEAIDSKNYKQAENLVKNVGVKDIYCPSTLSAKDADKIYGKVFADSIGFLLANCDDEFSRTYLDYKCAGGKNKGMCLNLVNFTDPNSWPETYAKQFCAKNNVEICAAAVERIPVEKSVPYLKAIKGNKLAESKKVNVKEMRSGKATRAECLASAQELYNAKLAEIERELNVLNHEWRVANSSSLRYDYGKKIKYWEDIKKELKSKGYSSICSDLQNTASFEKLKVNQYYFEMPFMMLTQKAAQYYWNVHNPIIPGLAENWADVDKLFDIANGAAIKSIEKMKDTTAKLNALADYMKKFEYAPYFIYKKNVVDNMKASFGKNEQIGDLEKLFYCKLYPSLEKESAKLFGMKILDCKALLEESKKVNEPCEEGSELFDGKIRCVEGKFEKNHWLKIGDFFVIKDYDYQMLDNQMSSDDAWNPPGMLNFLKHGRLYSWHTAHRACPDGARIPDKSEMRLIAVYGKDLITPSNAGYIYEDEFISYGEKTIYMTSSTFEDDTYFNAATINSTGEWNLATGYKMKKTGTWSRYEKIKILASILCITDELENEACPETREGFCYASNCCENGVFKKKATESMVDPRDEKMYRTVRIGMQTWMAENLSYDMEGNSYCYDNSTDESRKLGCLYTSAAAKNACPEGWHLPSDAEWKSLLTTVGGESAAGWKLKATSGWGDGGNGIDSYGFSALPSGNKLVAVCFEGSDGHCMRMHKIEDSANLGNYSTNDFGYPVRCVKD